MRESSTRPYKFGVYIYTIIHILYINNVRFREGKFPICNLKRFMYSMFTIQGKIVKHKRIIFPRKRKHVCDIYHARTVYRPYSQFNLTCFYRWNASFCAQRNPNHHESSHDFSMVFPWISQRYQMSSLYTAPKKTSSDCRASPRAPPTPKWLRRSPRRPMPRPVEHGTSDEWRVPFLRL